MHFICIEFISIKFVSKIIRRIRVIDPKIKKKRTGRTIQNKIKYWIEETVIKPGIFEILKKPRLETVMKI